MQVRNGSDYADNSGKKARGFNAPGHKRGIIRFSACHAIFNSLDECIAAIEGYIEHHNSNDARPFRWSKAPEDLVEAWKKGHQKLQESAS